jgi:HD-GYP domain-containing protein (c-di-GMP phosphodiesterase class II)
MPSIPRSFAIGLLAGTSTVGFFLRRTRRSRRVAERFGASALESLLNAIDANDAETGAHVRRVAAFALILADAADCDDEEKQSVERIALFHDIGKIHAALSDVLHEMHELTPEERRAIVSHPRRGARVLRPLAAFYPDLCAGVLSHHERWDGGGYPRGLRGKQIPRAARIVSIVDAFDAMTFSRNYRSARPVQKALDVIAEGRGTQFDPELCDIFLLPPVLERIKREMREGAHPRARSADRREGDVEDPAPPDVSFRWRREERAPHSRARGRKARR